jgi:hypothetical protein
MENKTENKIETIMFSSNQGEGIIHDSKDLDIDKTPVEITLGNTKFNIGSNVDLDGFFDFPHEYVGRLSERALVFYCGNDTDLFETRHFFKVINYITPKRIFVMYSYQSGRDYNFVENKWK